MTDELFMLITENICDYVQKKSTPMFVEQLLVESLDIIKRQQAEIEELTERLQEYKSFPCFTNDTQVVTVSKKADGQYCADRVATIQIDKIRAEAYKEFAERLLESKYESSDWSHGEHPYVVEESDIENLLYELTEGSNEKET